ncbi:MAG: four helix bundle protein [Thermodesulfovibrionales bacterium]|nr:four helix bundle protein [Thermodesulfovibrionales bacterium]
MNSEQLKQRVKKIALDIIKIVEEFPKTKIADIIARQLVRSASSVGANYRAACRARSSADFISKIGIVIEEADESEYWLELAEESGLITKDKIKDLIKEVNELLAIFVASSKTAKTHQSSI